MGSILYWKLLKVDDQNSHFLGLRPWMIFSISDRFVYWKWNDFLFNTSISLARLGPLWITYWNFQRYFWHHSHISHCSKYKLEILIYFIHNIFSSFPDIIFIFSKFMDIMMFFAALIHCLRYPLYISRLYWFSSYSGESVSQVLSYL